MCSVRLDLSLVGITSDHPDVRLHGVGVGRRWVCQGRPRGSREATHFASGAHRRSSSPTRLGARQHETTLILPRFSSLGALDNRPSRRRMTALRGVTDGHLRQKCRGVRLHSLAIAITSSTVGFRVDYVGRTPAIDALFIVTDCRLTFVWHPS